MHVRTKGGSNWRELLPVPDVVSWRSSSDRGPEPTRPSPRLASVASSGRRGHLRSYAAATVSREIITQRIT